MHDNLCTSQSLNGGKFSDDCILFRHLFVRPVQAQWFTMAGSPSGMAATAQAYGCQKHLEQFSSPKHTGYKNNGRNSDNNDRPRIYQFRKAFFVGRFLFQSAARNSLAILPISVSMAYCSYDPRTSPVGIALPR